MLKNNNMSNGETAILTFSSFCCHGFYV